MKKHIIILFLVSVLFSLSACGSNKATKTEPTAQTTDNSQQDETDVEMIETKNGKVLWSQYHDCVYEAVDLMGDYADGYKVDRSVEQIYELFNYYYDDAISLNEWVLEQNDINVPTKQAAELTFENLKKTKEIVDSNSLEKDNRDQAVLFSELHNQSNDVNNYIWNIIKTRRENANN